MACAPLEVPPRTIRVALSESRRGAGFTLLELLCVIAVIGILAALIFPGVRAARVATDKARTKVQFNQWAAAIEGFRAEYGYYPSFHASGLVNGGASADASGEHLFHDLLAGRHRDGSSLAAASAATGQNRKLIRFHGFNEADFTPNPASAGRLLCDAFGNTSIAVLVDRDLDGVIRIGSDYTALPAVDGVVPSAEDFPANGIRAGVIFYAPSPGATPENPAIIASWK